MRVLFLFLSLILQMGGAEVVLKTEAKAYPILKKTIERAGYKVIAEGPVVLAVHINLHRHLYEASRDEFDINILLTDGPRELLSAKQVFEALNYSRTPLWERNLAEKTSANYLKSWFKNVDLDDLLGLKELGKVVAVRGNLIVVDRVLPLGMKVTLFSPGRVSLDLEGKKHLGKEVLVAEGEVFNNDPVSSEIILTEVFSSIVETLSVRIQGR